jgi:hypothetical protein
MNIYVGQENSQLVLGMALGVANAELAFQFEYRMDRGRKGCEPNS